MTTQKAEEEIFNKEKAEIEKKDAEESKQLRGKTTHKCNSNYCKEQHKACLRFCNKWCSKFKTSWIRKICFFFCNGRCHKRLADCLGGYSSCTADR